MTDTVKCFTEVSNNIALSKCFNSERSMESDIEEYIFHISDSPNSLMVDIKDEDKLEDLGRSYPLSSKN